MAVARRRRNQNDRGSNQGLDVDLDLRAEALRKWARMLSGGDGWVRGGGVGVGVGGGGVKKRNDQYLIVLFFSPGGEKQIKFDFIRGLWS